MVQRLETAIEVSLNLGPRIAAPNDGRMYVFDVQCAIFGEI